MTARENGTVESLNNVRGCGGIRQRGIGDDIAAHYQNIPGEWSRSLSGAQRVKLELQITDQGPRADAVERLD